ncbi:polyprenyl synthetase family protein [Aquimarina litoralis]|uniref:polyprenyl synthetase family protein n=1 Tax=Aquimarina litoralis TaxID=584605 RepID=UPI001C567185|nr:polyprenyl synthetase family protein [Aquimarina litoralis]MBW1298570.1 hypothetical protein [Aquimarina litoralis]
MERIPTSDQKQSVFENLRPVDELTIDDHVFSFVKPEPIPIRPPAAWIKAMSSSKTRHEQELSDLNWDDYIEKSLQGESEEVIHFLKNVAKATASVHSTEASVRGMSYTLNRLVTNPGLDILNGPTNDTWFDHWEKYLVKLGVDIYKNSTITKIDHNEQEIIGLEICREKQTTFCQANLYIFAIPHHNLETLLPKTFLKRDQTLKRITELQSEWQTGLQFYLKCPIKMPRGHLGFASSPWSLSCILQTDFWEDRYKSETYESILSLIIANWDAPGIKTNKTARECTKEELIEEVIAQLVMFAPDTFRSSFIEMEVVHCEVDPGITLTGDTNATNDTPLFINKAKSWHNRPSNKTAIPNMYLAGDYTQTSAYLATMEGANESGKLAVNALLEDLNLTKNLCPIHRKKHEKIAKVLQPFVQIDEMLFSLGQPHLFDLVDRQLVEKLIDNLMPFMQFEGSMLETFDQIYDASMMILRDFNTKYPNFDVLSLFLQSTKNKQPTQELKNRLADRIQNWAGVNMLMVDKMPLSFPSNLSTYLNIEDPIFKPLLYTTESKGNGHRVKFAFAMNTWLGVTTDKMAHLLETGQCIHNCSLLIDDIMDDTSVRRKQTSAHIAYGVNQTLGAAYTSFFQILLSAYINLGEACMLTYLEEATRAHVGQSHDVYYRESQKCPDEESYLNMIANKTGSFFRVFVLCMLHLSPKKNASKTEDVLMRFSENIGLLFQIRDDYMDLVSEEYFEKKGSMASDFDEGKFSYPVVHCVQNYPETYNKFMEVFEKSQKTESDKLRLLAILKNKGSLDYTMKKIKELYWDLQEDLKWLECNFGKKNDPIRKWIQKLVEGVPNLSLPNLGDDYFKVNSKSIPKDPFDFNELPFGSIKKALRNIFCAYHVYYKGNGWSKEGFWQCFPLLLTVETMVFHVDNANEETSESNGPSITKENVEKSKIWKLIQSSGFYTDQMNKIYDQALNYYQREYEWYQGKIGNQSVMQSMNHLKSTNFRIMQILSGNILEKSIDSSVYNNLEDYVSLLIELDEYPQDLKDGVYNIYLHMAQLSPENPKEMYDGYINALREQFSHEQIDMAEKWLFIYMKGSNIEGLDEELSVEVSFRKVYTIGRDIATMCCKDTALANFTLEGNFKWCLDKFQQENKNILSSDKVFRKLQNNMLAKMTISS